MLLYLPIALMCFNDIEEDTYIYFRLAANIANGHGYVFNIGGEHIEAGSSLPWQLLLVAGYFLSDNLLLTVKLMSLAIGCGCLYLTGRLGMDLIPAKRLQVIPAYLLAASIPFYVWSQRGLDAPLNILCLLWLAYWCCHPRLLHYWFLPAIAVYSVRPEGFFMLLGFLPFLWLHRDRIRTFRRTIGYFASGCLMITLFRLIYFHDLVPHSFYHKMGGEESLGVATLWQYCIYNYVLVLAAAALPGLVKATFWKEPRHVLLLSINIVAITWAILGEDSKPFNRHIASWLPFLFLLGTAAIACWSENTRHSQTLRWGLVGLVVLAVFTGRPVRRALTHEHVLIENLSTFATHPVQASKQLFAIMSSPDNYLDGNRRQYLNGKTIIGYNRWATVGKFIKANYPKDSTIVFDQMGQPPWFAGPDMRFIDTYGLLNRSIGFYEFHRRSGSSVVWSAYESLMNRMSILFWPLEKRVFTREQILDQIREHRPDVVLIRELIIRTEPNSLAEELIGGGPTDAPYRPAFLINGRFFLFERSDLPTIENPVVPHLCSVEPLSPVTERTFRHPRMKEFLRSLWRSEARRGDWRGLELEAANVE